MDKSKMQRALSMITPSSSVLNSDPEELEDVRSANLERPNSPSDSSSALSSNSSFTGSRPNPNSSVSFGMIINHYSGLGEDEDENEEEAADDSMMTSEDIQPVTRNRAARSRNDDDDDEGSDIDMENEFDRNEVIMSTFWKGSKFGAAVYQADTTEVHVLADVPDVAPQFTVTKSFLNQIEPTQIVCCGRSTEAFIDVLKDFCGTEKETLNVKRRCNLNFAKSTDYKHDYIKSRILGLRLPCEPEGSSTDNDAHMNYIHSLIDLNNDCSVYALGGLLKFLDKNWCTMNLEVRDQTAPIVALKRVSLSEMVSIDLQTFTALQIFSGHISPNNINKAKSTVVSEGLSLFALFNRCKSTMGCKFLRMMMLKPTKNIEVLNERLDVIEFCLTDTNKDFVKQILDHMRNVKGVLRILTKLKSAQPTVRDWKSLVKTIYHVVAIGELCGFKSKDVPLFKKIHGSLNDDLYRVGQSINTIMDMNDSEEAKRFVVRPGIDSKLDKRKQEYNGMKDLLSSVAQQELADLPTFIPQCTVNYVPEMGYMLAVPLWTKDLKPDDVQLPNLEFLFISNGVAHYKTPRCLELDSVLGDILTDIMEKEMEVMVKLIQFVEKKINCITEIMDLLAEFDCLAAIATTAEENNYVRPVLTEERVFEVEEGRHPLQELCVSDFVPNDVEADESSKRMKILTGPNASGKSVYLKQVALLAYMAHIGSYVPATSAKIGLLGEIFTRIQTVESVSTRLSAFMIDLRQMALALQRATPRSLLVIDEFGKGTSELDGLALLAASLNHLLQRRQECPLVLVSTHFHSVTDLLVERDSPLLQKQTMDHLCNDKEVVFLHKLIDGGVGSSFAHQVAEAAGIDASVISRAREVMEAMKQNKLPGELPLSPVMPRRAANNVDRVEIERQRQNFSRFMTLTEEEFNQMDEEEYFSMIKDL